MGTAVAAEGRSSLDGIAHRALGRPQLVVAAATAFMAVATIWGLGERSVWLDEGFTVMHTRLPTGEFFSIVAEREANAVLHSVLVHGLVRVSEAEWWLRLPSALAATAAVPVTYLAGRRLFHPRVGAIAAVFLAANGFVVEYGQEGRGYALLLLLAALSTFLFVRALQEDRTGAWVAWTAVSCVMGYAHLFGVLVVAAQVLALLARRGLPTPWRRLGWCFGAIVVAHLPLAAFLVAGGDKGQSEGLPAFTPLRFVGIFVRLSGNAGVPLTLLVAIACAFGLVVLWRRRAALDEQAWGVLLVTLGIVVPVGAAALVSLVEPLYVARYFVGTIPALALLAAFGLTQVRPRAAALALGAGIVVLGVVGVGLWHRQPSREDARGVVDALAQPAPEGVQPGDAIVFTPWYGRIPVEVYLEDEDGLVEDLAPAFPDADWGAWRPDEDPGGIDADAVVAEAGADRVWVVTRPDSDVPVPEEAAVADALADAGYEEVRVERFDGLDLHLYERA